MKGYLDINHDKHHAAAEAGANMVYLWGFGEEKATLVDVTPQFKANFASEYGKIVPADKDVIPIFYNGFGEVDLDGYSPEKVVEMKAEFEAFKEPERASTASKTCRICRRSSRSATWPGTPPSA